VHRFFKDVGTVSSVPKPEEFRAWYYPTYPTADAPRNHDSFGSYYGCAPVLVFVDDRLLNLDYCRLNSVNLLRPYERAYK